MTIHDSQSRRVAKTFWKQLRMLQIKYMKCGSEKKGKKDQGTSERIKTMARVLFVNDKSRDWCTAKDSSLGAARSIFTHRAVAAIFIAEPIVGGKRKTKRVRTRQFPHSFHRTGHLYGTQRSLFLLVFASLSLANSSSSNPPLIIMVLDPAAMHRRNATLDLPSPRIGDFDESEPYSPLFYPPRPPSSLPSKHSRPRFTINQSLISRQWLRRTTFFALFSLFSVAVYILLVNGSSNLHPAAMPQQVRSPFQAAMNTIAHSSDHPWRPTHKDVVTSRPQITLTSEEELAALSSFIISLPDQNVLPSSVDPSQPIDPQLILDFDTRADGAEAELKRLVTATWENHPVVMYTKVTHPCLSISKETY